MLLTWGYVLLLAAWVGGNPPFAAPDESAHYVRAVSLAGGDLVGLPAPDADFPHLSPAQAAVVSQQTRRVTLPPGLSPQGWSCFVGRPGRSAACLESQQPSTEATTELATVGTYQPALYLLPGLSARAAAHPIAANLAGRLAAALTCMLLLAAAVAVSGRREAGPWPLVGIALAVTPMVLFTASALNPSGAEIVGMVAFLVAMLRLGRDREASIGAWSLAMVAGATVCLSRSLGPLWVAGGLALLPAWYGVPRMRALVAHRRRRTFALLGVLAAATVANVAYEASYGPALQLDLIPSGADVTRAAVWTGDALVRQAMGVFGYAEVTPPVEVHVLWRLTFAGAFLLALALGRTRQRIVLLVVTAGVVTVTTALEIALFAPTGFHVQGRHVLPAAVMVPMLVGDVLAERLRGRRTAVAAAVFGVIGLIQAAAWYANARRAAVGVLGTWAFPLAPDWQPVGGWVPWLLLAAVGALLISGAGMWPMAHHRQPRRSRGQRLARRSIPDFPGIGHRPSQPPTLCPSAVRHAEEPPSEDQRRARRRHHRQAERDRPRRAGRRGHQRRGR